MSAQTKGYPKPQWHPLLIVVSGPAGAGKDSLLKRMKELGYPLYFVVTATDRPPRPGEVHGEDYLFLSTEEILRLEEEGELLEHAIVYGQHKAIPKQQVRDGLASGKDVIMRVDVQGASTVRRVAPEAVLIFLVAPQEELAERLLRRGSDSPDQIAIRLGKVSNEMEQARAFDYIIENRDGELDRAVQQVAAIIKAEHCRAQPRIVRL